MLAAERGAVRKDWTGRIKVALAYPNHYHVGMSNLGLHALYRLVNDYEDIVCERVFLPENKNGAGDLRSVESQRPLCDFDIVAFSISFENDYPNLLSILTKAGIPRWSSERYTPHPLVIAGGVTAFLNPEPIAPFVDCFLVGEAEPILETFFEVFRAHRSDRRTLLDALAGEVPGAYVPALYDVSYESDGTIGGFQAKEGIPSRIERIYVPDLSKCVTCSTILTPQTTFSDTYLVEAARGCPHGCRFCAAGFVYRPPRFRSNDALKHCMEEGSAHAQQIGLLAAAVSDLPFIEDFCRDALNRGVKLSFSSLRADRLTREMIRSIKDSGARTVAIAPDAGSERMRRVINKGITEEDVLQAAGNIVGAGIPNLKLYFMVGLPTETPSDVDAVISLCKQVQHRFVKESRKKKKIGQLVVSLNSFIPKPMTPFQWVPLEDVKSLKSKIKKIKDGLRRLPNTRVHADIPKWAYVQALLSRGDRRTARLLAALQDNAGNWAKTLKASITNPDFYVYRERPFDEILPWDFIDHGIDKSFLIEEYQKALRAETTPQCDVGHCVACGVCK